MKLTGGMALTATVVAVALGFGCIYSWDVPARREGRYPPADIENSYAYVVPQILLNDPTTRDAPPDCAVAANRFRSDSADNHFWSVTFGVLQVAAAATGTAASGAAFENGTKGPPAKVAIVSYAIAAGIAALDQVYNPG